MNNECMGGLPTCTTVLKIGHKDNKNIFLLFEMP